ncbi:MAG: GldG family protein [Clostridia bacterium]|nr:GldG family protein [Clostridia bacterium]
MKLNMKNAFGGRALRYGGYSVAVSAIVIAVVILLNLGVNLLPATYTHFAADGQGMYDISDTSRKIMEKVEDKITIHVVGYEDSIDSVVKEYVDRYSDLSKNVSVRMIDPTRYPNFVQEYTDETLNPSQTNLLVVNEDKDRAEVILYSNIYYQQYTDQEVQYYYYYYGQVLENPTYFDIENQLTSAIAYVTMDVLPVIYYTEGHGEAAPDQGLLYYAEYENVELKKLSLSSLSEIPADASALLIYSPEKDFTAEEIALLNAYAEKGGTVILSSSYDAKAETRILPNLHGFAAGYGMTYEDVLVCEGSADSHPTGRPEYIYPQLCEYYQALVSSGKVLIDNCHAIKVAAPEGVTVTELLTTSVKGYAKATLDKEGNYEKADGDAEGKFVLGAVAQKKHGEGETATASSLYWFASDRVLDVANTIQYYANPAIAIDLMLEVCAIETRVVAAKTFDVNALTVSESSSSLWGVILIGVVPVGILAAGFLTWRRRLTR